ncbi:GNAT family N-acetyltransferase [Lysinibacillus sphaericus]|uniref:GNAT family N-acetyltransferase n=2 Tax=Lysinibacillus sphaericus TaxID=1421 RepID=UPI00280BBAEC|nr:GNAT family N-acetyltransferase [Lysinibacillus sphaericus]
MATKYVVRITKRERFSAVLDYKIITSMDMLEPYRSTWSGILEQEKNNNPFIEYEWVTTWWATLGIHDNVEIFIVEHQGTAVAFFPLVHTVGFGKIHYFGFLGQGYATYMEVIAEKQWMERAIHYILKVFTQKYKRYLLVFQGLIESKDTSQQLEKYAIEYQMPYSIFRTVTSFIDFQSMTVDDFLKKHRKTFKSIKRYEKKLKLFGHLDFQDVGVNHFHKMFTLFTRRWRKKLDKSRFTEAQTRLFYERLADVSNEAFRVEVDSLQFEGHWISFTIDLCCRDRNFCQAMGHEPDFNRFGPGSLIEKENMLKAHDSGFRYYDFGSGYEPYKFQWYTDIDFTRKFIMSTKGTTERFIRSWMVLRDRVKGKLTNNHQLVKLKRDRLGELLYFLKHAQTREWLRLMKGVLQRIVAIHRIDIYIAEQKYDQGYMPFEELHMKDIMTLNERPAYIAHFYKGNRFFGDGDQIVYRRHDHIAYEEVSGYTYELSANMSFIREYDTQLLKEIVVEVQREGRSVCTIAPWYEGRRRRKLNQAGFHKVSQITLVRLFKWRKEFHTKQ